MTTRRRTFTLFVTAFVASIAVFATTAFSATLGTWTKQSPVPTTATLNSVEMVSASEAWAGGESGSIIHSSDGGATWITQATPVGTEPVYGIDFVDSMHGWAGTTNAILYTTDGGATWKKGTGPVGSILNVGFGDQTTGFAVTGDRIMFKTTNGGVSWTSVAATGGMGSVQFFDGLNGVISGAGGVMHTYDGGKTFTTIRGSHGGVFVDHDHGWSVSGATAQYTVDGGATWKSGTMPAGQWIYSNPSFVDMSNGWAAGSSQGIIHTADGGKSWTTQMAPGTGVNAFWGIDFADASHGIAVGNKGIVYSTTDGGATWTNRQNGSATSTNDLAVLDSQHAWAAQAFGEILRTTDGGTHWDRQQVGSTTSHFYGIDFASTSVGFAVGDAEQSFSHGMIYGTKDGGLTWTLQWDGGTGYNWLYDVDALTSKVAVAVGNLGIILRTTDGGLTWREITRKPGVSVLSGVSFVGKVGYAVGNGSAVLRSTNAGVSWVSVGPNLGFGASLMDASFVNSLVGWVVGFDGEVLKTTDGGRTWVEQGFGTESGLNVLSVDAIDANTAWISGYDNGRNYVARTTNGGATWVEETIPQEASASSISDVEFLTADEGWAGGYEGIWKRSA
jgi:photosystem II stability/assembly factor-like uncharacterized protein